MAKQTQIELFLELAKPDEKTGVSRWVSKTEFVGKQTTKCFDVSKSSKQDPPFPNS